MTEAARRKAAARPASRLPVSRPVLWTGIALGAFLAAEALVHRVVLPLGLPGFVSAAITAVLIVALAVVVAELTRRHHRTAARHAIRHGKRGAVATARHARRHGGTAIQWLVAKAASRWESREHRPLMFRKLRGEPEQGDPEEPDPTRHYVPGHVPDPQGRVQRLAAKALMRTGAWGLLPGRAQGALCGCAACLGEPEDPAQVTGTRRLDGKPETGADKRFFDLRESGYTGPINQDGYAVPGSPLTEHTDTDGGTTSMKNSHIAPERRAHRAAARTGGSIPAEWGPVIAQAADFEPEDDGQLLDWMNGQVTGMGRYGEALVDLYDHCTNVIGIDPAASALLHDVADAVAHAAEAMAAAKQKFVDHYELPREFAGNGGLMTHDGRWVTGEGA
jgi:hypothetical protein